MQPTQPDDVSINLKKTVDRRQISMFIASHPSMHSDDRHLNTVIYSYIYMVTVCKMKIIQTIKLAAIVIVLSLFCIQMICRLSLTMRIKSHICYANDQFLSN